MNQILCSTGALIGRPNNRDYTRLKEYAENLNCDGFEFMVYGSWYPEFDKLVHCIKSFELNIPVIHCQKALGETLCGMKAWFENGQLNVFYVDDYEDKKIFEKGIEEFKLNINAANELGADRMVLHLWNGIPSDKNINKNIERFGILNDIAKNNGIKLMPENVVCNEHDPLSDLLLVHKSYPEASFVYDTKMAEFHEQTEKIFEPEWEWLLADNHIGHLHINDYAGGYMDWENLDVLPLGNGHVDFDSFFEKLKKYNYSGDYTVEATAFDSASGEIDYQMLNMCFEKLRKLVAR